MIELSADAGNRGQSLSAKAMMYFGKSLALDPKNPRANFFMAQMQYGMAQFFGSSTEKPCQQANMAVKLFKEQPEEQSFDPKWGQAGAEYFIKQCNN